MDSRYVGNRTAFSKLKEDELWFFRLFRRVKKLLKNFYISFTKNYLKFNFKS